MCNVINVKAGDRMIPVADIKQKYIENIIKQADFCDKINKIILFGSATESRCSQDSDIDLAIFGVESERKVLLSKSYKNFIRNVFSYDFSQDYDIIYFREGSEKKTAIVENIKNGVVLYEKNESITAGNQQGHHKG